MTCYHPLHAFYTGLHTPKGKDLFIIESGSLERVPFTDESFKKKLHKRGVSIDDIPLDSDVVLKDPLNSFYKVQVSKNKYITKPLYYFNKYLEIPCGKCIGCRLKYSQEWAVRCLLEAEQYNSNYFITLTYENSPGSLSKRDLQLFLKRLRKFYKTNYNHSCIRYLAAGEYGETTHRPHYHLILFNLPIPDLDPIAYNSKEGTYLFKSDTISKIWNQGFVSIGELNFKTAAYTARYCMKKVNNNDKGALLLGLEPEFIVMSRRPGIAESAYQKNKNVYYTSDEIIYKNGEKVCSIKPPRYFDNFFSDENAELFEKIHQQRIDASLLSRFNKLTNSCFRSQRELLDYQERLKTEVLNKNLLRYL